MTVKYQSVKVTVRVNGELEQDYALAMQLEADVQNLLYAVQQAVVNTPGWVVEE